VGRAGGLKGVPGSGWAGAAGGWGSERAAAMPEGAAPVRPAQAAHTAPAPATGQLTRPAKGGRAHDVAEHQRHQQRADAQPAGDDEPHCGLELLRRQHRPHVADKEGRVEDYAGEEGAEVLRHEHGVEADDGDGGWGWGWGSGVSGPRWGGVRGRLCGRARVTPAAGLPSRSPTPRHGLLTRQQRAHEGEGGKGEVVAAVHAARRDAGEAEDGHQVDDKGVAAPRQDLFWGGVRAGVDGVLSWLGPGAGFQQRRCAVLPRLEISQTLGQKTGSNPRSNPGQTPPPCRSRPGC
jgi:hypothetical protein